MKTYKKIHKTKLTKKKSRIQNGGVQKVKPQINSSSMKTNIYKRHLGQPENAKSNPGIFTKLRAQYRAGQEQKLGEKLEALDPLKKKLMNTKISYYITSNKLRNLETEDIKPENIKEYLSSLSSDYRLKNLDKSKLDQITNKEQAKSYLQTVLNQHKKDIKQTRTDSNTYYKKQNQNQIVLSKKLFPKKNQVLSNNNKANYNENLKKFIKFQTERKNRPYDETKKFEEYYKLVSGNKLPNSTKIFSEYKDSFKNNTGKLDEVGEYLKKHQDKYYIPGLGNRYLNTSIQLLKTQFNNTKSNETLIEKEKKKELYYKLIDLRDTRLRDSATDYKNINLQNLLNSESLKNKYPELLNPLQNYKKTQNREELTKAIEFLSKKTNLTPEDINSLKIMINIHPNSDKFKYLIDKYTLIK